MPTDLSQSFPAPANLDNGSDVSVDLLKNLFDANWWDIVPGSSSDAGNAASMLFPMIGQINLICLTIITVFFTYFIGVGLVGTAHEGSPLGKKYHSWWPLARFGFSISALAPVARGGLSIFQVLLLTAVGYSVHFANIMWDTALDYLGTTGGQLVATVPNSVYEETHVLAGGMLKSITLQKFYEKKWDKTIPGSSETVQWIMEGTGSEGTYTWYFQPPMDTPLSNEDMGGVTFYCPNTTDSDILATCNSRITAAIALFDDLKPIASELVGDDEGNRVLDIVAYENAIKKYNSSIASSLGGFITSQESTFSQELKQFLEQAAKDGWIMAGSYFWTLSRLNAEAQDVVMTTSSYLEPQKTPGLLQERFKGFEGLSQKVAQLRAMRYNSRLEAAKAGTSHSWWDWLFDLMRGPLHGTIDLIVGANQVNAIGHYTGEESSSGGEPVARMSTGGHYLINAIEAGGVAIVGAWLTAKVGGGLIENIPFLGDAASQGAQGVAAVVLTLFCLCALPLLVVGCTLAYYLPALPYILWVSAITGWIIVLIESLIAAPFWVAAHAMPEGEGIAGTSGRQGYMLLLGVLARPLLMLVGFLCACVVINFIGSFVFQTFVIFETSVNAERAVGLVTIGCMLILFTGLITVLSHKVFGLITHLPQNCLNWIGQQIQNLSSEQDEARTRGVFSQAGSQSHTMAQGVGRMMGERLRQGRVGAAGGEGQSESQMASDLKQGEKMASAGDTDWDEKKKG